MDTKTKTFLIIGGIAIIIYWVGLLKRLYSKKFLEKYPPGTGKKCTITGSEYSICTPPIKGDSLNSKKQEKEVLYYRELSREVIYKANDGFKIVGITYEYWD
jgi:hypothetical protein